ncbi:cyclase family protein [Altericroceibacterium endophyticum]|uniref:Cyclase family protein n=1 Tax=Altericroceibacterium endophyticum TaxID=1808508 RepID=A0A6I4T9G8_9SPHN|nr:cyclase family protein [Altericroceibacterium endophyticum]MXO67049.1 cyclase family protein [Altericroceibacterium endophyticum]
MSSTPILADFAAALAQGNIRVVDLTQMLSEDTPLLVLPEEFGQTAPFSREEISRYDERGVAWHWHNFTVGEHTGTHFDAPIHWVSGKDLPDNTIDKVPAKDLVAPAVVLDFSAESAKDADFLLTADHIRAWEEEHGTIPKGCFVLFRTDWSKRDTEAYCNRREDGAHTPGPATDAMKLLIDERDILAFGVETIGTDAGQAHLLEPQYPAHFLLHGAGKYGLQCMENLDQLPPTGAIVVAAPLKILNGSGSPMRVLAFVPA